MNLKGELHNLKKGSDTVDVYQKITMLWIKLVLIAYWVKCTIFLFKILNLQLLLLLNLYTLTCGVMHLLQLSMGLDITFCLLIIILDLVGFIY